MITKVIKILLLFSALLWGAFVQASFTYNDVEKLASLPKNYLDSDRQTGIQWLEAELEKDLTSIYRYQIQRNLFYEYYYYWAGEESRAWTRLVSLADAALYYGKKHISLFTFQKVFLPFSALNLVAIGKLLT